MTKISHRIIVGAHGADLTDTLAIVNGKIEKQMHANFQPVGAPVVNVTSVNDQAVYGIFQVMDTVVDDGASEPAPIIPAPIVAAEPAGFDPAKKGNLAVLSKDNLVLTIDGKTGNSCAALASGGKTTGMWYAEFHIDEAGLDTQFGVINSSGSAALNSGSLLGQYPNSWGYITGQQNGKRVQTDFPTPYGVPCGKGDDVGVAMDLDNGFVYISINGEWLEKGLPESGKAGTRAMCKLPKTQDTYYIAAGVWDKGHIHINKPSPSRIPKGYTAI